MMSRQKNNWVWQIEKSASIKCRFLFQTKWLQVVSLLKIGATAVMRCSTLLVSYSLIQVLTGVKEARGTWLLERYLPVGVCRIDRNWPLVYYLVFDHSLIIASWGSLHWKLESSPTVVQEVGTCYSDLNLSITSSEKLSLTFPLETGRGSGEGIVSQHFTVTYFLCTAMHLLSGNY